MVPGTINPAINRTYTITEKETLTSEKYLLYVAFTRAQTGAYITSCGKKSEILPD
jgi:ATP-dependent exoDNAse (exonuclease V) beta subunit